MSKLKMFGKVVGEAAIEYAFVFVICAVVVLTLYGLGALVAFIFPISLPIARFIVALLAGFAIIAIRRYIDIKKESKYEK